MVQVLQIMTIDKISVSLTKEEWLLVVDELIAGIECRDEDGDFIGSGFLSNIKYYIERALEESNSESD